MKRMPCDAKACACRCFGGHCTPASSGPPRCGDVDDHFAVYGHAVGAQWHKDFAAALNATGRPMYLEVVAGYWFLKHETAAYANGWRFCEDHQDKYESTAEAVRARTFRES